jgi:clan AA aspartic protease (TIGR02281 family)
MRLILMVAVSGYIALFSGNCAADMWKCVRSDGRTTFHSSDPRDPRKPWYECPSKDGSAETRRSSVGGLGCSYVPPQSNMGSCSLIVRGATARPGTGAGAGFSIPLRQRGGVYEVMATLNAEIRVFFVVDSGASDVTISENLAGLLVNNGSLTKADILGNAQYRFANGDTGSGKVVRLRSIDLDGHILKDVQAVVLPGNSVPVLLGQSALRQLGKWSINAKEQRLEITP